MDTGDVLGKQKKYKPHESQWRDTLLQTEGQFKLMEARDFREKMFKAATS